MGGSNRESRKNPTKQAATGSDSQEVKRYYGLCFRCQHRVDFLELDHAPRYECGQIKSAVHSCYMFRPPDPLILRQSDPKDPRPLLGPAMIASRACTGGPVAPTEFRRVARPVTGGIAIFIEPIRRRKKKT